MMKTTYDPEADAFYARFAPEEVPVVQTVEAAPGVMLDLDGDGQLIGVEVLSVRLRGHGLYGKPVRDAAE